ncbi:hypothetical protein ACQKKK_16230 [Peribacillus sp. NPDC006672]|uniref:hypothetical protein n=1 Tax=Peribacillus sp. NPDC006672 TaxID=3390606 RepID=UPI003D0456C2
MHNHLIEMTLAKRDSTWTIFINEHPEILNRVTDLPLFKNNQIRLSYLVEKGADINVKEDEGNTALSFAERYGNELVVLFLREQGS